MLIFLLFFRGWDIHFIQLFICVLCDLFTGWDMLLPFCTLFIFAYNLRFVFHFIYELKKKFTIHLKTFLFSL